MTSLVKFLSSFIKRTAKYRPVSVASNSGIVTDIRDRIYNSITGVLLYNSIDNTVIALEFSQLQQSTTQKI